MSNYFENENLTLEEWCKKVTDAGHELSIVWEGGGDSGWVHFEIDGNEEDNVYTRALVDFADDYLDYGSWAGEFQSVGSAVYSSEDNCFLGTDNYSEDTTVDVDCEIEIKVPKTLWFDSLEINFEEGSTKVDFTIKNGFLTDNHQLLEKTLQTQLTEQTDELIEDFCENNNFIYFSQDVSIDRSEFVENSDGSLTYVIESLGIGATEGDDRDLCLEITPSVEEYLLKQRKQDSNE
jgi:hypothetical protein